MSGGNPQFGVSVDLIFSVLKIESRCRKSNQRSQSEIETQISRWRWGELSEMVVRHTVRLSQIYKVRSVSHVATNSLHFHPSDQP